MITVKVTFKFNTGSTMQTQYIGEGIDREAAISSAFLNMAAGIFSLRLVLTLKSIEIVSVEEI